MADSVSDPVASKLRRPPQISLALDGDTHVLYVNRDLAGTGFKSLTESSGAAIHDLMHPDCDGRCRFNALFRKAWKSLEKNRASIEWEISDPVSKGHLRLNLSRPPTSKDVEVERRRRFALLTVTDITEIRREYESALSQIDSLQRRVLELEDTIRAGAHGKQQPAFDKNTERQLAQLNGRIIAAQEHERKRIAADLHDGVAQTLGVIKYGMESRLAKLEQDYPDIDLGPFDAVILQIREAVDDLRKISRNLSPSMLDEFGICTAVDMLCDEFGAESPEVKISCGARVDEVALPDMVKVTIYRIVQEALNNIRKHASPTHVHLSMQTQDNGLTLVIRDDGLGFDAVEVMRQASRAKGLGLDSMKERVEATGGEFRLCSTPGMGTTITATWPKSALQLLSNQPVLDRV